MAVAVTQPLTAVTVLWESMLMWQTAMSASAVLLVVVEVISDLDQPFRQDGIEYLCGQGKSTPL